MDLQVALLDSGATARVTEIAAKSLANLGSAPNNRTGIRLAGGIPPLVALLMEQPTPAVGTRPNRAFFLPTHLVFHNCGIT